MQKCDNGVLKVYLSNKFQHSTISNGFKVDGMHFDKKDAGISINSLIQMKSVNDYLCKRRKLNTSFLQLVCKVK